MSQNPRYTAMLRILIASLAAAGRIDEAQTIAQVLLEQEPTFHVASFCRTYAYKDPGRRETLASRSEEHTSELQSHSDLVCRLLLEKKKKKKKKHKNL